MAMTSPQLSSQRAAKRWKRYKLAVYAPATVLACRVNQAAPTGLTTSITFDGTSSGSYSGVGADMTVLIGSAVGLSDYAITRTTKAATSTVLYVQPTLGVINDAYVTVLADYAIWARRATTTPGGDFADSLTAFSSTVAYQPIVNLGPTAVVLKAGETYSPTASLYSPSGIGAASYTWTATGATASSGTTTASPALTYGNAGSFLVSCAVTDTAGNVCIAYRYALVNPADVGVEVSDISGDVDSGYWSASIRAFDNVDVTELRDRGLVVLWRDDYAGTTLDASYGPYSNGARVRLVGWIDGQSLQIEPDRSAARFVVRGLGYWLSKSAGSPVTFTDATAPADWGDMVGLTLPRALHQMWRWYTTAHRVCDLNVPTTRTAPIREIVVNSGNLFQQINSLSLEKSICRLTTDRFGAAWVRPIPALATASEKAALDTLFTIAESDREGSIEIDRETVERSSLVEISGAIYPGGGAGIDAEAQIYSRAPDVEPGVVGEQNNPYQGVAVTSQTALNQLAGDVLAMDNAEFPSIDLRLAWANDFIDLTGTQVLSLTIPAADNPRGVAVSGLFYPEYLSYQYDATTGAESMTMTLAELTTGTPGVVHVPPAAPDYDYEPPAVPVGGVDFDGFSIPPIVGPTGTCDAYAKSRVWPLAFGPGILRGDGTLSAFAYFPCSLPTGTTLLTVILDTFDDAASNFAIYAISSEGGRLVTGSAALVRNNSYTASFTVISDTNIGGFEIALTAGTTSYALEPDTTIATGTVNATDSTGASNAAPDDGYYYYQSTGGPWQGSPGTPGTGGMYRSGFYAPSCDLFSGLSVPGLSDSGTLTPGSIDANEIYYTSSDARFVDTWGSPYTPGSKAIQYLTYTAYIVRNTPKIYVRCSSFPTYGTGCELITVIVAGSIGTNPRTVTFANDGAQHEIVLTAHPEYGFDMRVVVRQYVQNQEDITMTFDTGPRSVYSTIGIIPRSLDGSYQFEVPTLTGKLGLDDNGQMWLQKGTAELVEPVGDIYARAYFYLLSAASKSFRVYDTDYTNNAGTLGWVFGTATARAARKIYIGAASVTGVCPVGT